MKVLIIAPLNKPECTGHILIDSFKSLGHDVTGFCYRSEAAKNGLDAMHIKLSSMLRGLYYKDLVLVIKGECIDPKVFYNAKPRKALWFFDFDSFEPPEYLLKLGIEMNMVFLICFPWVSILRKHGINALFLPQATDPMRFRPVDYDPIFSSDVSFIGTNKSSRRVGILSKIKDAGIQIRVWGEGWEGSGFEPGTPAYLNDFNKVCSSSKIMLNINQSEYWPEYSITFSQKVFMMAAAGSFILTDFIHGLNLFFREDQYATYSDSDLISRIRYFLNHEQERLSTASSVRSSILKSHTYIHRVRDIISCLGL